MRPVSVSTTTPIPARIAWILLLASSLPARALGGDDARTPGVSGGQGATSASASATAAAPRFPNILVVTVDTLRADRLSAYGYPRATSPHIDALLAAGAHFSEARALEPLTGPSMASLYLSVPPHEHGATRNGLAVRPGLPSLPKILARRGYRTAAFVGNWTLRGKLSGLDEHFARYETVLTRKRWFGLVRGEATADDITEAALSWLSADETARGPRPFFLWVHYVEPHAPYRLQQPFAARLGIDGADPSRSDRYDTEVAFVDAAVRRLRDGVSRHTADSQLLVVFTADHGESLGENNDFGHGRTLYEPALRVPLGIVWPGQVARQSVREPTSHLDWAPTALGLLGLPPHPGFQGTDWSARLRDPTAQEARPARTSANCLQAHRGAVQSVQDSDRARRKGLLEVATVDSGMKEIWRVRDDQRAIFDLAADPQEAKNLAVSGSPPSALLAACIEEIRQGLIRADALPPPPVDAETLEGLRALGYVD